MPARIHRRVGEGMRGCMQIGIFDRMATTIRVSKELRDRLNIESQKGFVTPAVVIERLLDDLDRRRRMAAFGNAVRTADEEYRQECEAWNTASDSGLGSGGPGCDVPSRFAQREPVDTPKRHG